MTAAKAPGILKKMLQIQQDLVVEKTGWDERNEYAYWRADDVAVAVRRIMNEVGVIHRVELINVDDASRVDAQGRERRRLTTTSRIIFIDPEDGSEFPHDVVATGSDIGGDKDTRKAAVQAFKIAAVDLFVVAEGMERLDSDGEAEAEPEDLSTPVESKAAATSRGLRELDKIVGGFIKDPGNPVTGPILKALADEIAEEHGVEKDSKIWRKDARVMEPVADILERALAAIEDKTADDIEAAIKLARTGEVD
ncbi:hypothetical protein SEA_OLINDD_69 [Microbacterium phage OlinDD]|nr:hypothetical protein SEA_OLINDD_69 [Microbacterium phage OlinDD]